jgi:hypothetical protein
MLTKLTDSPRIEFSYKEKLTLAALHNIKDYSTIDEITNFFAKKNMLGTNFPIINKLVEQHTKAKEVIEKFYTMAEKQMAIKPGDIVIGKTKATAATYNDGDAMRKTLFLLNLFSTYTHAGVAVTIVNNAPTIGWAGMWKAHVVDDINPRERLSTETLRFFPEKLLKQESKQVVRQILNLTEPQLTDKIRGMYKNIANTFNKHETLKNLTGPNPNKIRSSFFSSLFSRGHRVRAAVRDWAIKDSDGNLGKKIGDGKILCSEYTAKITALSIIELEKQLIEDIQKTNPQFSVPKGGLFHMPFPEYENLDIMLPQRLAKILKQSGAVEVAPTAEIIKKLRDRHLGFDDQPKLFIF